jgi:hypothetical protein
MHYALIASGILVAALVLPFLLLKWSSYTMTVAANGSDIHYCVSKRVASIISINLKYSDGAAMAFAKELGRDVNDIFVHTDSKRAVLLYKSYMAELYAIHYELHHGKRAKRKEPS